MKAEIISKPYCPYCTKAKNLLELSNIPYTEKILYEDLSKEQLLERVPEAKTVPQIWIDDNHIGGYDELVEFLKTLV